jgi:hypothetical protein
MRLTSCSWFATFSTPYLPYRVRRGPERLSEERLFPFRVTIVTKRYCAIIGDIKKSRLLPRRAAVQKRFARAIEQINGKFKSEIASEFLVTLGDEFQGLLHSPAESFHLIREFQRLMDPVSFCFGIGIGALSTPLQKQAVGMDGEAFHRARAALELARKGKREMLYGFDSPSLDLFNALIGLLSDRWQRLTPHQKEVHRLLLTLESQEAVARHLRISQPAVSKVASPLRPMSEAENVVNGFLRDLAGAVTS